MEYSQVMARFEAKDYEKAITGFKLIIRDYPSTYTQLAAYCNLGLTYEILRKWSEAVKNTTRPSAMVAMILKILMWSISRVFTETGLWKIDYEIQRILY